MLLFQGVEAFERWSGREAPVDVMNDALRARL
jgi:shikimate dehydrogenase